MLGRVSFVWQIFVTWRYKKRAGEFNKGIFENLKKKIAISRGKKKLEVVRTRQDSKKIY